MAREALSPCGSRTGAAGAGAIGSRPFCASFGSLGPGPRGVGAVHRPFPPQIGRKKTAFDESASAMRVSQLGCREGLPGELLLQSTSALHANGTVLPLKASKTGLKLG